MGSYGVADILEASKVYKPTVILFSIYSNYKNTRILPN